MKPTIGVTIAIAVVAALAIGFVLVNNLVLSWG